MNSRVLIETILGFIVILVALTFVYIAYNSGNVSQVTDGYDINAKFTDASGLTIGSDVRISGIKIGNVTQQTIDQSDGLYQAMITLTIESAMKLPVDSSAAIVSESLLGGKYVSISPGGSDNFLKNGDSIIHTQSAINIEELIGKFVFGGNNAEEQPDSDLSGSSSLFD